MKSILKRLLHLALLLCIAVSFATTAALADSTSYSITMNCMYNGTAISGVTFHIYRVLEKSGDSYVLTSAFSGSGANVKAGADNKINWADVANTLAVYARAHSASIPSSSAPSDNSGNCTFTLNQEEESSYLILGDSLSTSSGTYTFSPSLVTLPDSNGKTAVTATVKVSYTSWPPDTPPDEDPISVTVLKVWNDGEQEDLRPDSISVSLLRNDRVFQTVQLSKSNNWRYTWNNLSSEYDWSVIENSVPNDYGVSYSQNGNILSITNTYTTDINPPEPPKTDEPTTDIPPEPIPLAKLPQTGLLQWPVPIMAILGIILFSRGWWEHFRRQKHEN